MTAFYIASDRGVDMFRTQALLVEYNAIWCPPPNLRPWNGSPEPGDQLTLSYLENGSLYLLGIGCLARNETERYGTNLLFTDPDLRGVRDRAEKLGYGGGSAMSFLVLRGAIAFGRPFPCLPAHDDVGAGVQVFAP